LIEEEINFAKAGTDSSIILKLNSLEDRKMIEKLYEASNSNVKIDIVVRGVCCLIPGIKGMSDNIRVISIIDRFLEHSRVFIFHNNGDEKIYISSADWMKRNLSRRIEVAFPVNSAAIKSEIKQLIEFQLNDNVKARVVDSSQNNEYAGNRVIGSTGSQSLTYDYLRKLNS
jgi:polyphosphate kinase